MAGIVFNIQRFSLNDGPGIRTTVFLKGCPLDCLWCHNPESKSPCREVFYSAEKCIGCGACVLACKEVCHSILDGNHRFEREKKCTGCGDCVSACVTGALEMAGREVTAQEVITEVLKDKSFFEKSGGGITLSGGEPLHQLPFAIEILKLAKDAGINTAIETSGFVKTEQLFELFPLVDLFLFDYKVTNSRLHKEYTGASNELILKNLKKLDAAGAKIILRCPIIPGYNDNEEHFSGIVNTANSLQNLVEINLEPYHPLDEGKAEKLGVAYALKNKPFVPEETVNGWIGRISAEVKVPVKKA